MSLFKKSKPKEAIQEVEEPKSAIQPSKLFDAPVETEIKLDGLSEPDYRDSMLAGLKHLQDLNRINQPATLELSEEEVKEALANVSESAKFIVENGLYEECYGHPNPAEDTGQPDLFAEVEKPETWLEPMGLIVGDSGEEIPVTIQRSKGDIFDVPPVEFKESSILMPTGIASKDLPFMGVEYKDIDGISFDGSENVSVDNFGIMSCDKQKQIRLTIKGDPTAQKRHRSVNMGKFTRQYDPSAADKKDFLSIVQENAPEAPISSPIRLELFFYFARPKAHFGTGKKEGILKDTAPNYHTSKPDADNICKFIMDSLNAIYWKDDSYICELAAHKLYDINPRTEIIITVL